jgi:hypothetical protein
MSVRYVIAVGGAALAAVGIAPQDPPQFRASVDEVLIDVSVFDGKRAVQGLTTGDFEVLDNGIRQDVLAARVESGPIDVALVIQRRGNQGGFVGSSMGRTLDRAVALASEQIPSLLEAHDRLDVLPAERLAGPAGSSIASLRQRYRSSIFDELTAAMMLAPSGPGHRRLVIGITGGVTDRSVVPDAARLAVAMRTDAVLHLVSLADFFPTQAFGFGQTGVFVAAGRASLPLEPLSRATGGRTYRAGPAADVSDILAEAIAEFRTRYVLRYRPTGVAREGWHEIEVAVKGKSYEIRHRRGYEIAR